MMNYTLKSTTNCATVFNQNDSQRRIWRHQLPYSHLQDTLQMCKFSAVPGLQHLIWLRLHGGCSLAWVYVFPMWMVAWSEGTCFLFSASVSKGKTTAFYSESHVSCNPCRTVFIQYFFCMVSWHFFKAGGSMEPHIVSCTISFALLCVCFALLYVSGTYMRFVLCVSCKSVCCAVCFALLYVSQCERLVGSGCKGSCIT